MKRTMNLPDEMPLPSTFLKIQNLNYYIIACIAVWGRYSRMQIASFRLKGCEFHDRKFVLSNVNKNANLKEVLEDKSKSVDGRG